jgi:hypothetical protein
MGTRSASWVPSWWYDATVLDGRAWGRDGMVSKVWFEAIDGEKGRRSMTGSISV